MADEIDRAQANDELFREQAIQEHFNRGIRNSLNGTATKCEDCETEIPAARRKAMPGCTRCVGCQHQYELLIHWRAL